jgi:hypothetical protein
LPWTPCGFTRASVAIRIAVKPDVAILEASWEFEEKSSRLNSSSSLNQVNNQHDDRNDEQEMYQTAANVTNEAKEPEYDQYDDYSPQHG